MEFCNSKSSINQKAIEILSENGIQARLLLIHFPQKISVPTIEFLVSLHKRRVDFITQSSFYRPLYKSGLEIEPDFSRWDQRKDWRSFGSDTDNSIIEWLMINLPFCSTDISDKIPDGIRGVLRREVIKNLSRLLDGVKNNGYKVTIELKGCEEKIVYNPKNLKGAIPKLFIHYTKG